jgi:hypothetical protein
MTAEDNDFREVPGYIFNEQGRILGSGIINHFKGNAHLCSKCLKFFENVSVANHARKCQIIFSKTITRKLNLLIVSVTNSSPEIERRICERLSKLSMMDRRDSHPVLRKGKWCTRRWQSWAFLLVHGTAAIGYLVIGTSDLMEEGGLRQQLQVADMFIVPYCKKKGYMRFLLLESLKSMHERFDTVAFQEPLSEEGEQFLDKISKELGQSYQTC